MSFVKDKSSIKYFVLAVISIFCIYSANIANLFIPIFDNVYYGNLVKLFISLTNLFIWLVEFLILFFVCKKLKINLFTAKEKKNSELPLWRLCILFALVVLPMIVVSIYLNFKLKLVYNLGLRITSVGLACNACEILSYTMKIAFIVLFIRCVQEAFDINIKFKKNIIIPWGAILSFLIFGLIDFFFFPVDINWFYLVCAFWYGIIYLVADRKYLNTCILCYLIWLL